jgi:hypothetical protein
MFIPWRWGGACGARVASIVSCMNLCGKLTGDITRQILGYGDSKMELRET